MTTLVIDTFAGVDGTTLGGRTPDTQGSAWVQITGDGVDFQISSNQLAAFQSGGQTAAVATGNDGGTSAYAIVRRLNPNTSVATCCVAVTDGDNLIGIRQVTATQIRLLKRVAGTLTDLITHSTSAVGEWLKVEREGSTVRLYTGGTGTTPGTWTQLGIDQTVTDHATEVRQGVGSWPSCILHQTISDWESGSLSAGPTTYTLNAEPVTLTISVGDAGMVVSRLLNAAPVGVAVSVADASMSRTKTLTAEPVAVLVAVGDAALTVSRHLSADPVGLTVSVSPATFARQRVLSADPVAVTVSPAGATLTVSRVLRADPVNLSVTVFPVQDLPGEKVLSADAVAVAVDVANATLAVGHALLADPVGVTVGVADASLNRHWTVVAAPVSITAAVAPASFVRHRVLVADPVTVSVQVAPASMWVPGGELILSADPLSITVVVFDATFTRVQEGVIVKFSGTGNVIAASQAYPFHELAEVGVTIWGNFTGTVTLEGSPDNGTTWVTLPANAGLISATGANTNFRGWVFTPLLRARMTGGQPGDTWNVAVWSPKL